MRRREEREDSPFDDENGEEDIDEISISNYSKRYQGSTSHSNYPPMQATTFDEKHHLEGS